MFRRIFTAAEYTDGFDDYITGEGTLAIDHGPLKTGEHVYWQFNLNSGKLEFLDKDSGQLLTTLHLELTIA